MDYATSLLYSFSLLGVFFGLHIFLMDRRDPLRIVFLALCVVISASAFTASRIYSSADRESIAFWERINFAVVVVCWSVNLNFYVLLTERRMRPRHYFLLYAPMALLVAADSGICHIVGDYVRSGNRWRYAFTPMYFAYMAYSIGLCVVDMALVVGWGRTSGIRKHRLQAFMIIASTIPLWLVCIFVDYVLATRRSLFLLPIGPLGRVVYVCVLWLSFVKYRFMSAPSSILLKNVAFRMEEIVFLIDRDARVLVHNERLPEFAAGGRCSARRNFADLLDDDGGFRNCLAGLIGKKMEFCHLELVYRTDGRRIATDSYLSGIVDEFGDLVGVLVVSREDKNILAFRERYRISARQMEIIRLILNGHSNADISDKLRIARRTTETHIRNVYAKLGIDNRIELYNLMAGFRLAPGARSFPREPEANNKGPLLRR